MSKHAEFSREQVERIDEVENAAFDLCKVLTEDEDLEWNIEFIGEIADLACTVLKNAGFKIRYPYRTEDTQGNEIIAWHGLAKRGDDPTKDEYVIYDILVYPQEVTGATVDTDQVEYQTWLYKQDDETFPNIRMQGHSHVNMSTTPSSVDTALYRKLLDQLDDTMFYIFLVWNKRNERTIKIYDLAKNIMFDTYDVDVGILEDGTGIEAFVREAKTLVREKKYSAPIGSQAYASAEKLTKKKKKRKENVEEIDTDIADDMGDLYSRWGYYGNYGMY